uniref:Uncharacterized protein n=1 Tax=viral metagenome TaxID=1070528 RepID=A0A6M3XX61_9ZZZZ
MKTVLERKQLKDYFVNELHGARVIQQTLDEEYFRDTFKVPDVPSPFKIYRTGRGAWMINRPIHNIITSRPQVFRRNISKTDDEPNKRILAELVRWLWFSRGQVRNSAKMANLRGESWLHPVMNERWDKDDSNSIPLLFEVPDPMIVFADYNTMVNGIPSEVIILCERSVAEIQARFPRWNPPTNTKKVDWFEHWDTRSRYFEAGNIPISGIQKNILGFVPFVHCFSGFGLSTYQGLPEDEVMGRLTMSRDKILQQTTVDSDITSAIHQLTFPYINIFVPVGAELPPDFMSNYKMGPRQVNIIPVPDNTTPDNFFRKGETFEPKQEVLMYSAQKEAALSQEDPPILTGSGQWGSGREADIVGGYAKGYYDALVENIEDMWATAIGTLGLQMIEKLPDMYPPGLNKTDINGNYQCKVELKADDPIERGRSIAQGSRLKDAGLISHKKFLIEHYGMTEEEADNEIDEIIVEDVTINDPVIRAIYGRRMAEKMGWQDEYEMLRKQGQEMDKRKQALNRPPEIETPPGEEMERGSRFPQQERRPPEPYTRGGM